MRQRNSPAYDAGNVVEWARNFTTRQLSNIGIIYYYSMFQTVSRSGWLQFTPQSRFRLAICSSILIDLCPSPSFQLSSSSSIRRPNYHHQLRSAITMDQVLSYIFPEGREAVNSLKFLLETMIVLQVATLLFLITITVLCEYRFSFLRESVVLFHKVSKDALSK